MFNKKNRGKSMVDINVNRGENNKDLEYVLYVVTDRHIPCMINILRSSGLKVSTVFENIVDAKNEILMQGNATRLVLIDTGTGRFTTTAMRAEITDMLGISDEQNKTTVFYTDSALKVDITKSLGKIGRAIDWQVYKSTSIVIATILSYKENYKYDRESPLDHTESEDAVLSFKGEKVEVVEGGRLQRYTISGLGSQDIKNSLEDDRFQKLDGYNVKIR